MRRLSFTSAALSDLTDIAIWIARQSGSRAVAQEYVDRLIKHLEKLASLPGILGTDRSELLPGMRSTPHTSHIVFFRYLEDGIQVVNVLHSGRDLEAIFDA